MENEVHAKEYVTKDPLPTFRSCFEFPDSPFPSVPVVAWLEGALDWYVQVRGLILWQLGELDLKGLEVRGSHLLIERLGQHVDSDVVLAGVGPQVDLGQDLKKRKSISKSIKPITLSAFLPLNCIAHVHRCGNSLKINIYSLFAPIPAKTTDISSAQHPRGNESVLRDSKKGARLVSYILQVNITWPPDHNHPLPTLTCFPTS